MITLTRDLIAERRYGEMLLWLSLFIFLWLAGPVVAGLIA